ncbi:MAG: GNAT family N-acetyltransferase [Oscillospiraceae bacterium]
MNYELRKLSINDGRDVYEMLQEISKDENGFENSVNGLSFDEYSLWLKRSIDMSNAIGLESWMVPQTTFWLFVEGVPVGFGKIRHYLTDKLKAEGGHVGYAIRPNQRGKGYGKLLLNLLLAEANKMGIENILVTVRNENKPSLKVALANGGVIDKVDEGRHYIWLNSKTLCL